MSVKNPNLFIETIYKFRSKGKSYLPTATEIKNDDELSIMMDGRDPNSVRSSLAQRYFDDNLFINESEQIFNLRPHLAKLKVKYPELRIIRVPNSNITNIIRNRPLKDSKDRLALKFRESIENAAKEFYSNERYGGDLLKVDSKFVEIVKGDNKGLDFLSPLTLQLALKYRSKEEEKESNEKVKPMKAWQGPKPWVYDIIAACNGNPEYSLVDRMYKEIKEEYGFDSSLKAVYQSIKYRFDKEGNLKYMEQDVRDEKTRDIILSMDGCDFALKAIDLIRSRGLDKKETPIQGLNRIVEEKLIHLDDLEKAFRDAMDKVVEDLVSISRYAEKIEAENKKIKESGGDWPYADALKENKSLKEEVKALKGRLELLDEMKKVIETI